LRQLQDAFLTGEWYRYLIPAAEALSDWPSIELDTDQVEKVQFGHRIPAEPGVETRNGLIRSVTEQGDLVALLELVEEDQEWQPKKVFFQT
jgi:tRNA pseudouridine55 synthase